jgi:hypothetical protein
MAKFLKRKPTEGSKRKTADKTELGGQLSKLPAITEYLTLDAYDGGVKRKLSTLSLWYEEGKVKGSLNDKEEQRSLYASADSLETVLEALEAMIVEDRADWRAWKKGK